MLNTRAEQVLACVDKTIEQLVAQLIDTSVIHWVVRNNLFVKTKRNTKGQVIEKICLVVKMNTEMQPTLPITRVNRTKELIGVNPMSWVPHFNPQAVRQAVKDSKIPIECNTKELIYLVGLRLRFLSNWKRSHCFQDAKTTVRKLSSNQASCSGKRWSNRVNFSPFI